MSCSHIAVLQTVGCSWHEKTSETDGNVIICAPYIDEKSGDHQSKNVSFEKGHVEKFEFGLKLIVASLGPLRKVSSGATRDQNRAQRGANIRSTKE